MTQILFVSYRISCIPAGFESALDLRMSFPPDLSAPSFLSPEMPVPPLCLVCAVPGIKPRALCIQGMRFATEISPGPFGHFCDRISLCGPGLFGTHYVVWAGLKPTTILLPPPSECWNFMGPLLQGFVCKPLMQRIP